MSLQQEFAGEKHQLLKLPNGDLIVANFSGPGTHVIIRIARGDVGLTPVDMVAMAHDLRYLLATSLDQVREADKIFVRVLLRMLADKKDLKFNIIPPLVAISGKIRLEEAGLLDRSKFSGPLENKPTPDPAFVKKLDELESRGFGLVMNDNQGPIRVMCLCGDRPNMEKDVVAFFRNKISEMAR